MKGHAEIGGAGLAGLATAVSLAQHGWTVRVHERNDQLREFGAGLFLWENAMRVLELLGAHDELAKTAHRFHRQEIISPDLTVLQVNQYDADHRAYTVRRNDLYQALLHVAVDLGVEFSTSSPVRGADPSGQLVLGSGEVRSADLVVGCDGVSSRVRESLSLTQQRSYDHTGAVRLLIDRTEEERTDPRWEAALHFLGPDHTRIVYAACAPDQVYVALGTTIDDTEGIRIPVDKALWISRFPRIEGILDRIDVPGRWDQYQEVICSRWSRGRAAIVGDAAHAMHPHLGQGACLALVNGRALGLAMASSRTVEEGLQTWEEVNRPLTDHTQKWSRWRGRVVKNEIPLARVTRPIVVRIFQRSKYVDRAFNRAANSVPA